MYQIWKACLAYAAIAYCMQQTWPEGDSLVVSAALMQSYKAALGIVKSDKGQGRVEDCHRMSPAAPFSRTGQAMGSRA